MRFLPHPSRAKFAVLLFLLSIGVAANALQASPDLTGKIFSIEWRNEDGSLQRTVKIAFVNGVPGRPVSATLLEPTQKDAESYPNLTFTGTYSTGGKLQLRLVNPEVKVKGLLMELDVSSGLSVSGKWMFAVGPSFGVGGDAEGKCLNPDKSNNWSKAAILTAVIVFLIWAAYKFDAERRPPISGKGKGAVDDPTDPWNDLKKRK